MKPIHPFPGEGDGATDPGVNPRPRPSKGMGAVERALREDLAAAFRLVALHGWDDPLFSSLSLRVAGTDQFLVQPFGLLFDELNASSLVKVDSEGVCLDRMPWGVNVEAFRLHHDVYAARPDIQCAMILGTVAGQAVAASPQRILPITGSARMVIGDVAPQDTSVASSALRGSEGANRTDALRNLGEHNAILIRHLGPLALGRTVAETWLRLFLLERACSAQVAAIAAGAGPAALEGNETFAPIDLRHIAHHRVWPAMRRRLDRLDPSYRD